MKEALIIAKIVFYSRILWLLELEKWGKYKNVTRVTRIGVVAKQKMKKNKKF